MTATINASTSSGVVITPDNSGNILLQYNGQSAPAFLAYAGTTNTVNGWTKLTVNTEVFDTNNNFSSSRFTPTVAGYYQVNGNISINTGVTITNFTSAIYKNGSEYVRGSGASVTSTSNYAYLSVSGLVYMNGTTDYIEYYVYASSSVDLQTGQPGVSFSACLLRGA